MPTVLPMLRRYCDVQFVDHACTGKLCGPMRQLKEKKLADGKTPIVISCRRHLANHLHVFWRFVLFIYCSIRNTDASLCVTVCLEAIPVVSGLPHLICDVILNNSKIFQHKIPGRLDFFLTRYFSLFSLVASFSMLQN